MRTPKIGETIKTSLMASVRKEKGLSTPDDGGDLLCGLTEMMAKDSLKERHYTATRDPESVLISEIRASDVKKKPATCAGYSEFRLLAFVS